MSQINKDYGRAPSGQALVASDGAATHLHPSGVDPSRGDLFASSSAVISPCGRYRYRLERDGPGEGRTAIIMVNPSTADAEQDDATIRKLKGFGARNGWGRIIVGNLFAYRATDVRELAAADDPVGPMNDHHLSLMMKQAERVIFAWGRLNKIPKQWRFRIAPLAKLAALYGRPPLCIGEPTKCGQPPHPLMLAYETRIIPWAASGIETQSATTAGRGPQDESPTAAGGDAQEPTS